jgi:hypothetical protein
MLASGRPWEATCPEINDVIASGAKISAEIEGELVELDLEPISCSKSTTASKPVTIRRQSADSHAHTHKIDGPE